MIRLIDTSNYVLYADSKYASGSYDLPFYFDDTGGSTQNFELRVILEITYADQPFSATGKFINV